MDKEKIADALADLIRENGVDDLKFDLKDGVLRVFLKIKGDRIAESPWWKS